MATADFRKFCTCGTLFLSPNTFEAHRLKGKSRCAPFNGHIVGIDAKCLCGHISMGPEDAIVHRVGCGGVDATKSMGKFRIHCSCGEEFAQSKDYVDHRSSHKSACASSPVFMATSVGSLNPFSRSLITSDKQLAAFFGDLDHKREVVNKYQVLGSAVASFFDGKHMAWYVRRFAPDLIDVVDGMSAPSVKTIATIFEYHFHISVNFRLGYLRWLPNKLGTAPMLEPDGSLPAIDGGVHVTLGSAPGGVSDVEVRRFINAKWKKTGGSLLVSDLNAALLTEFSSPHEFGIPFFPIGQINPVACPGVPSTADRVYGWANDERAWRSYPELMGYVRQTSGVTTGDFYPWFFSSGTNVAGDGMLEVHFPLDRSPFDNEENGSLGQLDGLSHWKFKDRIDGFEVAFTSPKRDVLFTSSPFYQGQFHVELVPWEDRRRRIFVSFSGPPNKICNFTIQRFVKWRGQSMEGGPRPESPRPGKHEHTDL